MTYDRAHALAELHMIQQEEDETGDCEQTHVKADAVLCNLLTALGYEDVVKEYEKLTRWYA